MTRLAVRLHAAVKHPRHKSTGIVTELTTFPDAAGMALVAWPREYYAVTWLGVETLHVVRYRTPSPASKRRLAAKIEKAAQR